MAKNILQGPPPYMPVPRESTGKFLYKYLVQNVNCGNALINEVTQEKITYKDLLQNSCRLAQSLTACGLTSDKTVALCSENNVNFFTVVAAALYVGIPVVPINPIYTEDELSHALQLTQPDTVFCSRCTAQKFCKLRPEHPYMKRIIIINSNGRPPAGCDVLHNFIDNNSTKESYKLFRPVDVNDKEHVAFIMFSSGTTGLPKGVMITHNNVNSRAMLLFDPTITSGPDSPVSLGVLPFFHAYGLHTILGALIAGRKIIVLEKFDPAMYLTLIEKYKISVLMCVPPLLQFLAKSPIVDKFDLSSIKEILCGGAYTSDTLEEAVKKRLKVDTIRQGYGLTETTLGVTYTPVGKQRPGSCGSLNPGTQCVVRDPETQTNLGPFQPGELCVKGDVVMKGYYRNEKATRDAYTEDGWLRTGDLGYYDNEGYFYIVDRLKELIKYKGFQVAPAELEAVLLTHPNIMDAAVIGLPDEDAGELPLAFVVRKPDAKLTEDDVKTYVARLVSPQKHLRGGVTFVENIPKNQSGKILRRELRKTIRSNFRAKL